MFKKLQEFGKGKVIKLKDNNKNIKKLENVFKKLQEFGKEEIIKSG